jgi:hypothetical protein
MGAFVYGNVENLLDEIAEGWKQRHRGKPAVKLIYSGRWSVSVNQYGLSERCKVWGHSESSINAAFISFWDAFDAIDQACDCTMQDQPERPVRLVPVRDQSGQPVQLVKLVPLLREVR